MSYCSAGRISDWEDGKVLERTVVMVVQHCGMYLMPLDCTLKNGRDRKFCAYFTTMKIKNENNGPTVTVMLYIFLP